MQNTLRRSEFYQYPCSFIFKYSTKTYASFLNPLSQCPFAKKVTNTNVLVLNKEKKHGILLTRLQNRGIFENENT